MKWHDCIFLAAGLYCGFVAVTTLWHSGELAIAGITGLLFIHSQIRLILDAMERDLRERRNGGD